MSKAATTQRDYVILHYWWLIIEAVGLHALNDSWPRVFMLQGQYYYKKTHSRLLAWPPLRRSYD